MLAETKTLVSMGATRVAALVGLPRLSEDQAGVEEGRSSSSRRRRSFFIVATSSSPTSSQIRMSRDPSSSRSTRGRYARSDPRFHSALARSASPFRRIQYRPHRSPRQSPLSLIVTPSSSTYTGRHSLSRRWIQRNMRPSANVQMQNSDVPVNSSSSVTNYPELEAVESAGHKHVHSLA
jgi:hypothetical protein